MGFELPDEYGFVVLAVGLSWVSNFYLKNELYNCAQRAHQNTLENWAPVQILILLNGILFPRFAAACGVIWS
eukprot:gene4271-4856_t